MKTDKAPKDIVHHTLFGIEARAAMARGADLLASAVAVTLGPKGRNVIIDSPGSLGMPRVSKDGVTVARDVRIDDKFESMGLRMIRGASEKQNDEVGDGTTTVTVISNAIIKAAIKTLAAGYNPIELKRGIDAAASEVIEFIAHSAKEVETDKELHHVAMVSSNADTEIAGLILEAIQSVGHDGIILSEESRGAEMDLDIAEGMRFDGGYTSPYFVTNPESQNAELENPYVLIFDGKISRLSDISAIMEQTVKAGAGLVIIAENFDPTVLNNLIRNKVQGGFPFLAIKLQAVGMLKREILEDLSAVTGSPIFSQNSSISLPNANLAGLGRARRIIAGYKETTIVDGGGDKADLEARVSKLKRELEDKPTDKNLKIRLANITGGIAVIRVGGATAIDIKERRDRVDDAIQATRAAIELGIVPGGGTILAYAALCIALDMPNMEGSEDHKAGKRILIKAIEAPIRQIVENAGQSGDVILANLEANFNGNKSYGYNARTDEYGDLIEQGIIDPAKVVACAVKNAAAVAGSMITSECMISERDE